MSIYERQQNLGLYTHFSAIVIGCGGTGSWVAFNLALMGISKIYLFDNDVIQEHNLNRTPYKLSQIGMNKAEALKELILERRDIEVHAIPLRLDEINQGLIDSYNSIMFDCSDNLETSKFAFQLAKQMAIPYIRIGLDGDEISVQFDCSKVWKLTSANQGYTMPSWLIPAQFVACIGLYQVLRNLHYQKGKRKEIISKPLLRCIRFDSKRKRKHLEQQS